MTNCRHIGALVLGLLAVVCLTAGGADYYVAVDGDDTGAGTTWATAFKTISNAVAVAGDGDTIGVSNGTYAVTKQIVITSELVVTSLLGRSATTIDGGGTVFAVQVSRANAVFDGFTISNADRGLTLTAGTVSDCDIIYCLTNNGVRMTGGVMSNCTVAYNTSTNRGGGIYITGGKITHCTIEHNTVVNRGGGGAYMQGGSLLNCEIGFNKAPGNTKGGGVFIESGGCVMEGCNIYSNYATYCGGGICSFGASHIRNCNVFGNAGTNSTHRGGAGIYLTAGTVTGCVIRANMCYPSASSGAAGAGVFISTSGNVLNSIITGNRVLYNPNYGGGGISLWTGGTVKNCIITSNVCYRGGGVHCYSAGTVKNCLIAWNYSSNRGGGIHASYGSTAFENCTVVGNTAGGQSGGVHYFVSMVNMLIYSNSAPSDPNWYTGGTRSADNCCSTPSLDAHGTDNIIDNPLFENWSESDFRLSKASPCVNAGLNMGWMLTATDLDGWPRIDTLHKRVDIGAYELMSRGTLFSSY